MADAVARAILDLNNDPSSPYYLHPNENPALVLVSSLLTEQNYHSWSRSLKMAFISKNKMKFLDGTIPVLDETDPTYFAGQRYNKMLLSWLSRAVSPDIAESVLMSDRAVDVWNELHDRFAQHDVLRIAHLLQEIHSLKQGDRSVRSYFTEFKVL